MLNKSTTIPETKNSKFTSKDVKEALECLPYNYILKTQAVLQEKVDKKMLPKNFSKQYIMKIRNGDAFQEDILEALIIVGTENKEKLRRYGFVKKQPETKYIDR